MNSFFARAKRMPRPKVVRARGLLFYPVRRSCSSAIQLALGYDFVDWQLTLANYSSWYRFSCYRNTFERLRSLYHNFVNPAPQGAVSFDLPYCETFDQFLYQVCKTDDKTCNEHLHSQDWHLIIPNLTVWQFEDRESLFDKVLKKRPEQLGPASPDLSYLQFDADSLRRVELRYAREIADFQYAPAQ